MKTRTKRTPVVLTVADDRYLSRWDFCIRSQDAYAARHGFKRVIRGNSVNGMAMKWSKLAHTAELLRKGHPVLLLDADTEVTDRAPPFTAALAQMPQAGLLCALGVSGRANSGVMILNGPAGLPPLEAWLASRGDAVAPEHFVTSDGENGHLIALLASGKFESVAGTLPPEWNCSLPEHADTAYIRHFTNHLRRALRAGSYCPAPSAPLPPASATEATLRDIHAFHNLARPVQSRAIAANADFSRRYKAAVLECGQARGLQFPRLAVDDGNAWLWRYEFATGLLDLPSRLFWERLIRRGAVIVDGGAHIGYFTRSAAARGCRVIAVEPHPDNAAALRHNAGDLADCVEACLGAADGTGLLIEGKGHTNATLISRTGGAGRESEAGREFEVPMRSIDSICAARGLAQLNLIKLDIEGYEPEAVRGAAGVIAASADIVLMLECNPKLLARRSLLPQTIFDETGTLGLVPRKINPDFTLGAPGVIDQHKTCDYLVTRPKRWKQLERAWGMSPAPGS